MTPEDLASVIFRRRCTLRLSQAGLAQYALDSSVTQESVSRWERGEGLSEHAALLTLLEALGVELVCRPVMR